MMFLLGQPCLVPASAYGGLPIKTDLIPVRTSSDTHEGTNDNSLCRQLKVVPCGGDVPS